MSKAVHSQQQSGQSSASLNEFDWNTFRDTITELVPTNLPEKIHLFLKSYVPKEKINHSNEIDFYQFSYEEIREICRDTLEVFFVHRDEFFTQLTDNLCKMIF